MSSTGVVVASVAVAGGLVAVLDLLRTYFYISTPAKVSAEEVGLPALFSKLKNARDVATGKKGLDGRKLKTGLLFRSAKLHNLPDTDKLLLKQLGIKFVADFRSQGELQREPDSFLEDHKPLHRLFPAVDGDPYVMMKNVIRAGSISPGFAAETMKDINRKFVNKHAKQFREFLESLAQETALPAIVHCTAGKDRTGWAVALLLIVLGVSEEVIMNDYLLSNQLYYKEARKYMVIIRLFSRFNITNEDMSPLLVQQQEYLEAALNTAKESHGTMEKYITAPDGLGLTADVVTALRERFLQAAYR